VAGRPLPAASAGPGPRSGGWELRNTEPPEIDLPKDTSVLEQIDRGKFFLKVRKVDFDTLTRHHNAYLLASTWTLYQELQTADPSRQGAGALDRKKAVLFHTRLTRPLLGMILLLLSLSVILRDQNRNIFISAGLCLVLCGVFFAAQFVCKSLGDNDYIAPALAAWLPVLFFGPPSVAMFDAIHT
jgi:lipopolysaccharide export system permease protein